jgi:hypothetical protein
MPTLAAAQKSANEISARVRARRDQAAAEWRSLAELAAETGTAPDPVAVEAIGFEMGMSARDAAGCFSDDVAALQAYPRELGNSESMLNQVGGKLAEFGGEEAALAAAIAEADRRLSELRGIENSVHWLRRGGLEALTRARFLAGRHSRVFPKGEK